MSLCRASHQHFMFFDRFQGHEGVPNETCQVHLDAVSDDFVSRLNMRRMFTLSLSLSSPSASLSNMRDHWNADSSDLVGTKHCVRRQTSQHLARTHMATVEERHLLSCLRACPHTGMKTNHFQFFQSTPPVTVGWYTVRRRTVNNNLNCRPFLYREGSDHWSFARG